MSQQPELHPISLQYQVRTSKHGHREVERLLLLLGELQNAVIRHRRLLGKAGVPNKEILRLQNADITELRQHDPAFASISRKLSESVVKRVNDAYHRAFTVPSAGFPETDSPYQFRTLEISEPSVHHVQFRKSGVAEIHIKGLPILWFKTDHRINVLEQPKAIRITQHGRALTATLVYEFPNYQHSPTTYQSCGIDPGVVQRLTVVNDQHKYQQSAGLDASQHRKTVRRLKRQMQRCRDAAIRDGRARWVNVKRPGGRCQDEVSHRGTTSHSHAYVHHTTAPQSGHSPIQRTISYSERRVTTSPIKTFQFAEPVKHPYSRSTPRRPDHQHRSGSPPTTALPNLWTTVNMNTQPYIGVTGIAEPSQAKQLLEKMTSLYGASQLMCGVILSNSRIQGEETDHPNRHPDIETIPSIFPTHERYLNLIHYCPPDSPMIDQLLQKALEAGGPNCHGVQINTPKNVAWTPVAPVEKFSKRNPNAVIILQITRAAVEELLCNPERIAGQCRLYQEATSRFIIDLSAGNAIPINVELSAKIANAIQERMPEASITFAGGLSPQNVARISQEIRAQHTNPFSIDAEGALRTSEDHLNMRAAGLYISQATKMSQTPTQQIH